MASSKVEVNVKVPNIGSFFNAIKDDIRKSEAEISDGLLVAGQHLAYQLKQAYFKQEMDGPPLAQSTLARKARLGLDLRKLIETGDLAKSWKVKRVWKWTVHVYSDLQSDNLAQGALAAVHEFGSLGGAGSVMGSDKSWIIPARPVIQKTFDREQEAMMRIIAARVRER